MASPNSADDRPRILVIKLGAFGDFILAMGPFAAIRRHHTRAEITLLTTRPYADLARSSPYFDRVWIDDRPSPFRDPLGLWRLRQRLRGGRFARVYDLQTGDRSSLYFRLFGPGPKPEWSGIASGASHPHANPARDRMHTVERQREQLAMAGIPDVPAPDLGWLEGDLERLGIGPAPLALLVPGGAAHRPAKRWPAEHFRTVAEELAELGLEPVVLGSAREAPLAEEILSRLGAGHDLTGATGFGEIASLARRARLAIGNDTGPIHLIAALGCPTIALFSAASDPVLTRPRGPAVTVLQRARLADLLPAEIMDEVAAWLAQG